MKRFKKVLLINPPFIRLFGAGAPPRGVKAPLGLCYIAGVLNDHGFDVRVYNTDFIKNPRVLSSKDITAGYNTYLNSLNNLDLPVWREIYERINDYSPDIVGITAMTSLFNSALNVAQLVKSFDSDIPVVLGGVHPTILPEETIKNTNVDIVVRGEGEYTFLDILKNFNNNLNEILGITYKENGQIINNPARPLIQNLDELPFPAKHLIIEHEKYPPEAFGNIFASRGCPFHCIFCASHKIWTRKVRRRSPENVIEEIKHVKKKFGTKLFRFEDDSFTLNKQWIYELCDVLLKEKLKIKWVAETRADVVDDRSIKTMKSAGCKMLDIGVESGSEKTLKIIKKGITLEQIRNTFNIIKSNKILTNAFFIIGFPWESKKEIEMTISFMKELNPFHSFFSISTPYPGTELFDIYKKEGLLPDNMNWAKFFHQSDDMYLTKKYSREEVSEIVAKAEKEFEKNNRKNIIKLVLTDPEYLFGVIKSNEYYKPKRFFSAIRYMLGW
ncbi:radical SAM protein [Candidatus Parcubacteria bacterium]|nr:radical SAM protein [Candidatus Parcubacteria bacterium]